MLYIDNKPIAPIERCRIYIDSSPIEPVDEATNSGKPQVCYPNTGILPPVGPYPNTGILPPIGPYPNTGILPPIGPVGSEDTPKPEVYDPNSGYPEGYSPYTGNPNTGIVSPFDPVDEAKDTVKPEVNFPNFGIFAGLLNIFSKGVTKISKGKSGVWCVDRNDNTYMLQRDGRWSRININLFQVSSGASVWGVNRGDEIFKYLGNNKWQRIKGGLTNVDVSNKDHVWGVDRANNIWRWTASAWEPIKGSLRQISVGEAGVWGVDTLGRSTVRVGTFGDPDTAGKRWMTRGNQKFQWVASLTNLVIGVTSANAISFMECPNNRPTGIKWIQPPWSLIQVFGPSHVQHVYRVPELPADFATPDGLVDKAKQFPTPTITLTHSRHHHSHKRHRRPAPKTPPPPKKNINSGTGPRISKGKSGVWCVDKYDNVYMLNSNGTWSRINGRLVQVSSGASVWGVNREGEIYKYLGNHQWQRIEGVPMSTVDVSNKGHVWGVGIDGLIYRRTSSSWEMIKAPGVTARQISVGDSGVWAVGYRGRLQNVPCVIYRNQTVGDDDVAGRVWTNVNTQNNAFQWIASLTGIVIAVDNANDIWYKNMVPKFNVRIAWTKVPWEFIKVFGTSTTQHTYRIPAIRSAEAAKL